MEVIRKMNRDWYFDYCCRGKRYIKAISKNKSVAKLTLKDTKVEIETTYRFHTIRKYHI